VSDESPNTQKLRERLLAPGPKRILSLDGGGTRGIITLAFLARIETALCEGDPNARLSDYFDLIGGTSTGAIIATALCLGWSVSDVRQAYERFGRSVFRPRWYRISPLVNRYDAGALERLLRENFGFDADGNELLIGSSDLRTGLAITTKRLDTGSPWVVSNIPWAPFYADRGGPNGNWRIPLRNLVRASTAAPTFFRSVQLPLGPSKDGVLEVGQFVDGGASPYNNPAMRLVELARLRCFGLQWTPGKDHLMIVSVGTGQFRTRHRPVPFAWRRLGAWFAGLPQELLLFQALRTLEGAVDDGVIHAVRTLQALGYSPQPVPVDSEIRDMREDLLGADPLFTVLRYDLDLDRLVGITAQQMVALHKLDAPDLMSHLWRTAQECAARDVVAAHLRFGGEAEPSRRQPPR
jgi:predicted acylesterase/phospholipase RssA